MLKISKKDNETKSKLVQRLSRFQLEMSREINSMDTSDAIYIGRDKITKRDNHK
jgi:hypothetical protein